MDAASRKQNASSKIPQSPALAVVRTGLPRELAARNQQSGHAEEIALADLDAIVAQDAVRDGGMEIEVRKHDVKEELLARQGPGLARTARKGDLFDIAAFELRGRERLDVVDGPGEPLLQFLKALLGVRRSRHVAMGEPRAGLAGEIAGELDLFVKGSMSG